MGKTSFNSPLGFIEITTDGEFIKDISFVDSSLNHNSSDLLGLEACKQLNAYFDKRLTLFDLPLNPEGTDFQKRVWVLLQTITFGKTMSYLDLAKLYGNIKTIRAIAAANGKNPIAIVIPCHRVIGSKGDLVGYAGGLDKKKYLLDLESDQINLF